VIGGGDVGHVVELGLAHFLADEVDQISRGVYRDGELLVARKPDAREVTQADRAVEDRLRVLLAEPAPTMGSSARSGVPPAADGSRWLIDPIDATRNFIHGVDWTLLICEWDPRSTGNLGRMCCSPLLAGHGGPSPWVKVERPQRSEDERP